MLQAQTALATPSNGTLAAGCDGPADAVNFCFGAFVMVLPASLVAGNAAAPP